MKYMSANANTYLNHLAAKLPAPGGGSCAAFSAAMAAGLVSKVCLFTIGKEKYRKFDFRIKKILSCSLRLRRRLSGLVDEDIKAYKARDLVAAINVPAQVCLLSYELILLVDELMHKGNKNLLSDAVMAAILSEAAFTAGFLYVKVNISCLEKKTKRDKALIVKLNSLLKKVRRLRKKVEVKIGYIAGR